MFGYTYHNLFGYLLTERERTLDPVYCGSRERALETGELIPLSERTARKVGFVWPVAVTRAVFEELIRETVEPEPLAIRLESFRLELMADFIAGHIDSTDIEGSHLLFSVHDARTCRETILEVRAHGGDNEEPVLTIRIVDSKEIGCPWECNADPGVTEPRDWV